MKDYKMAGYYINSFFKEIKFKADIEKQTLQEKIEGILPWFREVYKKAEFEGKILKNLIKEGYLKYIPTKKEIEEFERAGIDIKTISRRVQEEGINRQMGKEERIKYLQEITGSENKIFKSAIKNYN